MVFDAWHSKTYSFHRTSHGLPLHRLAVSAHTTAEGLPFVEAGP